MQYREGDSREESDGVEGGEQGSTGRKKRWWQSSGEKKPQKFGWITGVLVRAL